MLIMPPLVEFIAGVRSLFEYMTLLVLMGPIELLLGVTPGGLSECLKVPTVNWVTNLIP